MMWIKPDWPVPSHINAITTTRAGGYSQAPYASMNLGTHVDDDPVLVVRNRASLTEQLHLPDEPLWLEQVHSTVVADADSLTPEIVADASVSHASGKVCVVMTADCLPVLFTNKDGTIVAAAHAGWRGLNDGVLEATVKKMRCDTAEIAAWLGPAIGPKNFEVGEEVRDAFVSQHDEAQNAFKAGEKSGKWFADIYHLARIRLSTIGINSIHGGGLCTYDDSERFFSYRRDGVTGRMASLIWISD